MPDKVDTEQVIMASLAGRTITEATFSTEGDSSTGCDIVTLRLADGRNISITSHGWHDISRLVIGEVQRA